MIAATYSISGVLLALSGWLFATGSAHRHAADHRLGRDLLLRLSRGGQRLSHRQRGLPGRNPRACHRRILLARHGHRRRGRALPARQPDRDGIAHERFRRLSSGRGPYDYSRPSWSLPGASPPSASRSSRSPGRYPMPANSGCSSSSRSHCELQRSTPQATSASMRAILWITTAPSPPREDGGGLAFNASQSSPGRLRSCFTVPRIGLALQAALFAGAGGARRHPPLRHDGGLPYKFGEPGAGVGAVAFLRAVALRDEQEHAVLRHPPPGELGQARQHTRGQRRRARGVEAQLHGRGNLVHVLPARAGRQHEALLDLLLRDLDLRRNPNA